MQKSIPLFIVFESELVGTLEIKETFFNLEAKMGLNHVVLTEPTSSPKKTTTLVEMQQLPNIEKIDSKDAFFCPNGEFTTVAEKYV